MQILIAEIERLRKELKETVGKLELAGYEKAKSEYTYRVSLAKELLLLRDQGLPATERLRILKIELGIVERHKTLKLQRLEGRLKRQEGQLWR